jgi:hypothetical protein
MKRPALFLLVPLLAAAPLLAQDDSGSSDEVLKNATFSDGTTYWHGDCKPAGSDSSTDFITSSSNATGLMVELHSTSWTKVTQEIRSKPAPPGSVLTVTYQVSSDFKLSDRSADYVNCGPNVGFGGANIPSQQGKIIAFVDVPPLSRSSISANGGNNTLITIYDDHVSYAYIAPAAAQSPQTFTVTMHPPPPTPDCHQTFCLAFPPGSGSITFTKVSLAPGSAGGSSPNP